MYVVTSVGVKICKGFGLSISSGNGIGNGRVTLAPGTRIATGICIGSGASEIFVILINTKSEEL